jgi:hypothetical protein
MVNKIYEIYATNAINFVKYILYFISQINGIFFLKISGDLITGMKVAPLFATNNGKYIPVVHVNMHARRSTCSRRMA